MRYEIDTRADAAYIEVVPGAEVSSTEEIADNLFVDLDSMGLVVGVEIIGLGQRVTLSQICTLQHVKSDLHAGLEQMLRAVSAFTVQQNQLTSASRIRPQPSNKKYLEFS